MASAPIRLAASLARRLRPGSRRDRIVRLTGATREEWRAIAAAFPQLPSDPGPSAARARERLGRRWTRALRTGDWRARIDGAPPEPTPTVYVTAHLGSLQALRYVLRARGVLAATVLGPHNLDRPRAAEEDRVFDSRYGLDFPHVFAADRPHRLRAALKRGSLILAADLPLPGGSGHAEPLGGRIALDARPLRLARAARVPCRAAFLTLPADGWTLSLSEPLPADEASALGKLARALERVVGRAPLDLDPTVYRSLVRGARGA